MLNTCSTIEAILTYNFHWGRAIPLLLLPPHFLTLSIRLRSAAPFVGVYGTGMFDVVEVASMGTST